jgi:hypothetical protein
MVYGEEASASPNGKVRVTGKRCFLLHPCGCRPSHADVFSAQQVMVCCQDIPLLLHCRLTHTTRMLRSVCLFGLCCAGLQPSSDEQYGGPTPLSEPESRLLRALLLSRPTLGYVNVHSGEWALYTPWDSKDGYAPGLPVSGGCRGGCDVCQLVSGVAVAVGGASAGEWGVQGWV